MPGMGGLELATHIREVNPSVKVFLMTAFETDIIREEIASLKIKVVEIFQKPVSMKQMSEIIVKNI